MTSEISEETPQTLDGKYELIEKLGDGGMGEVYLVRHLHLQQERVVKILRKELADDEAAQQRFLREAQLATHVKHPNVAILYDYAQLPDKSFYTVWEYIDGLDAGKLLERDGPFGLETALRLGIQALRGLEALHSAGVVHRDVSPDNLMVTRDNRGRLQIKIIDLGLAKGLVSEPRHDVTQAGMFMGKLRYCSPEQAEMDEEAKLDARSDLYSFALVLYEMICGKTPFEASSPAAYVFKRLSEDPLPLADRNPKVAVPETLSQVLARGLERDREKRFPDAISFIEALDPVAAALSESATQRIPLDISHRSPSAPGAAAAGPPRERTASRISREEKDVLLAQIDRAARKVRESSKLLDLASGALEDGDLERARKLREQLMELNPRASGLAKLTVRLLAAEEVRIAPGQEGVAPLQTEEAVMPAEVSSAPPPVASPEASPPEPASTVPASTVPASIVPAAETPSPVETVAETEEAEAPPTDRRQQVRAAERMLEGYLREGKLELARLALESLLELSPDHPKGGEYRSWIELGKEEAEKRARAMEAVERGRQALAAGDLKGARRHLQAAEKLDPEGDATRAYREEMEEEAKERDRAQAFDGLKERFERALADGDLEEAEAAMAELENVGLSKVGLGFYASQLDQARRRQQEEASAGPFRQAFEAALEREDFDGARSAVHDLSEALPESTLPAKLLATLEAREQQRQRRQSIGQGIKQVEAFLDNGDASGAALALKILKQMDPGNSRWLELEKRIQALRS